eukprot:TRINITY_DN11760_c0_g1_i1.p1 TRINITY_DN11760_c0_g1~~TRINITY_DN11760_c0_g1_i1.p1  ORF type:complete len:906 (+),score=273.46 TRINITY_DN11760_c0_g1_i1:88-2805(+)
MIHNNKVAAKKLEKEIKETSRRVDELLLELEISEISPHTVLDDESFGKNYEITKESLQSVQLSIEQKGIAALRDNKRLLKREVAIFEDITGSNSRTVDGALECRKKMLHSALDETRGAITEFTKELGEWIQEETNRAKSDAKARREKQRERKNALIARKTELEKYIEETSECLKKEGVTENAQMRLLMKRFKQRCDEFGHILSEQHNKINAITKEIFEKEENIMNATRFLHKSLGSIDSQKTGSDTNSNNKDSDSIEVKKIKDGEETDKESTTPDMDNESKQLNEDGIPVDAIVNHLQQEDENENGKKCEEESGTSNKEGESEEEMIEEEDSHPNPELEAIEKENAELMEMEAELEAQLKELEEQENEHNEFMESVANEPTTEDIEAECEKLKQEIQQATRDHQLNSQQALGDAIAASRRDLKNDDTEIKLLKSQIKELEEEIKALEDNLRDIRGVSRAALRLSDPPPPINPPTPTEPSSPDPITPTVTEIPPVVPVVVGPRVIKPMLLDSSPKIVLELNACITDVRVVASLLSGDANAPMGLRTDLDNLERFSEVHDGEGMSRCVYNISKGLIALTHSISLAPNISAEDLNHVLDRNDESLYEAMVEVTQMLPNLSNTSKSHWSRQKSVTNIPELVIMKTSIALFEWSKSLIGELTSENRMKSEKMIVGHEIGELMKTMASHSDKDSDSDSGNSNNEETLETAINEDSSEDAMKIKEQISFALDCLVLFFGDIDFADSAITGSDEINNFLSSYESKSSMLVACRLRQSLSLLYGELEIQIPTLSEENRKLQSQLKDLMYLKTDLLSQNKKLNKRKKRTKKTQVRQKKITGQITEISTRVGNLRRILKLMSKGGTEHAKAALTVSIQRLRRQRRKLLSEIDFWRKRWEDGKQQARLNKMMMVRNY